MRRASSGRAPVPCARARGRGTRRDALLAVGRGGPAGRDQALGRRAVGIIIARCGRPRQSPQPGVLNTLPERIALARREVLDYADFLQDPPRRRAEPARPRAAGAAPAPGRLRAALPARGLRLVGTGPARPQAPRHRLLAAVSRPPRTRPARGAGRCREELPRPGAQRPLRGRRPVLPRDGAGPGRPLHRERRSAASSPPSCWILGDLGTLPRSTKAGTPARRHRRGRQAPWRRRAS